MNRLLILLFISLISSYASAYEKMDPQAVEATLSVYMEDFKKLMEQEGNVHMLVEKSRFDAYNTALNNRSGETFYNLVIGAPAEPYLTDAYTKPLVFKSGCFFAMVDLEQNTSNLKAQTLRDRVYTLCTFVDDMVNPNFEYHRKNYLKQIRETVSDQVKRKTKRIYDSYSNSYEAYKDYPSVKAMTEMLKLKAFY